jgi:hypothetical protein
VSRMEDLRVKCFCIEDLSSSLALVDRSGRGSRMHRGLRGLVVGGKTSIPTYVPTYVIATLLYQSFLTSSESVFMYVLE